MLTDRQKEFHIAENGESCPRCGSQRITIGPVVQGDPPYRLCNCQDCHRAWKDILNPREHVIDVQEL